MFSKPSRQHILKVLIVEFQRLVCVANAEKSRAATLPLTSALAESGWIREAFVVENVVEVEALDAGAQSGKGQTVERMPRVVIIECDALDAIVVTRLAPEEVDTYGGTVKTEVELLLGRLVFLMVKSTKVYRITEKEPSPTEIRTEFDTEIRGKDNFLSILTAQRIHLVSGGLLEHERIVVKLRLDIGSVHGIECLDNGI